MNSNATGRTSFSTKPLVAAVALALLAPAAFADNGMPGAGLVVRNQPNVNVNGVALPGGNQIIGLISGDTLNNTNAVSTGSVIQWGSAAAIDTANKPGFNIATGKVLNFACVTTCGWLNIDISGKLSQIDGKIVGDKNSVIAIANEKGITISSGATIVAPSGFAALGSPMNTISAIDAFAIGAKYQTDFKPGAPVTVAGNLSGVGTYLLVAGSDAVSVSGKGPTGLTVPISVIGGVGSDASATTGIVTLNDLGPASATVRSSAPANVTFGYGSVATPLDASALGHNLIVFANGDLTNNGVLEFAADGPVLTNHLQWTGMLFNTGTLQTTTALTSISTETGPSGNFVSWFNNKTVSPPLGGINNSGLISAKDGSAEIVGVNGDSTNSGTIFAGNGEAEFESLGGNVLNTATGIIHATSEVTVHAGDNPFELSTNPHSVTNLGTITSDFASVAVHARYGSVTNGVTGVIMAGDGTLGDGDIELFSNQANSLLVNSDTINLGTLTIRGKTGFDGITMANGSLGGNITLGGTPNTASGGIMNHFEIQFQGQSTSTGVININTALTTTTDKGSSGIYLAGGTINVNAPLTVTEFKLGAGAGDIEFFGTNATGLNNTTISKNLTAGEFFFSTDSGGGLFDATRDMNVNLNGNLTTTAGGSRTVSFFDVHNVIGPGVITANNVLFDTSGDVRNPSGSLPGPNNYLLNGVHITTVGANPLVTVNARGPVKQAINLGITGNATVTSGATDTSGICYSGLCVTPSGGYIPAPNSAGSILVTASGNLTVGRNDTAGTLYSGGTGGLSSSNGFLFPGAVAFVAGGTLQVNATVDNAYKQTVEPFQGVFFQGATINALQPIYTNGNALVNYSVRPNGGVGLATVFTAREGFNFLAFRNLTAVLGGQPPTTPNTDSYINNYVALANAVSAGQNWTLLLSTTPITQ